MHQDVNFATHNERTPLGLRGTRALNVCISLALSCFPSIVQEERGRGADVSRVVERLHILNTRGCPSGTGRLEEYRLRGLRPCRTARYMCVCVALW